ncbi:ABC transporter permease [Actinomyces slackii]|uniref:FtsX-like permease family n=1 Tax=Actinomyces slackii TaxID=52774 RepID=A0A3S4SJA9_9ACTO|nr:ABC transporter permease [Actinomyces slackii]VEG74016.1 FtsX-like permease family [Actinomyces slackii]
MTALIWKDLRHHARQWVWSLCVTTTGAVFIGVIIVSWSSALEWSAAQADPGEYTTAAHVLGSNLVNYVGLAIAAVVSSTLSLTVTAQARAHAMWKIIGIPAYSIRRIIMSQVAVVGALGGLLGGALSPLATRWYLLTWQEFDLYPSDMPVVMPAFTLPLTVVLTAAFSLLGGLGAARRAAATPEMQALREAAAPVARTRIWQWVVAGILLIGVVSVTLSALIDPTAEELSRLDPEAAAELAEMQAAGGTGADAAGVAVIMLLMAALCVPAWTLRPLQAAWTALVPGRSPAWFAARANALHRSAISLTTVVPFAICVGMTGTIFSVDGAFRAASGSGGVSGFGAVAVPIFIIAGIGGVANIAMVGSSRRQEGALLGVIGADHRTQMLTTILEGTIYAVTGILTGLIATTASACMAALISGGGGAMLRAAMPVGALAPVIVAVLVLSITTTWLPAQVDRRPVMDRLRQPV